MKNIFVILVSVLVFTACKKEKIQPEPASTNPAPNTNPTSIYKKLKTIRSVDTYTFGTINIMNQLFTYDSSTGRLFSISQSDSSYSSNVWTVSSYTGTLSYNGLGNPLSYVISPTAAITYAYDSNNKIKYEIQSYGSAIDTTTYTYIGNNYLKTRYGTTGDKIVDYYSMNLDSSITYNTNNVIVFRYWWTYNQNLDLSWAYIRQHLPAFDIDKNELVSDLNSAGNFTSYSYTYDSQNYPIVKHSTTSVRTSNIYYTYY